MISINTDKGADILLELLRQSQIIKENIEKNKNDKVLNRKENKDQNNFSTRAFLRSPNTDGNIILSRKGHFMNQRIKDESYLEIRGWIEDILNRMTAMDYKRLSEAGFQVEDLTIESLTFAVQLIKDYDYTSGKEMDKEGLLEKNNESNKKAKRRPEDEIRLRMEAENLPANKETIERVKVALELSQDISNMDRKDILYILRKELSPTIENLYKARFSSQNNESLIKLSDDEWSKLIPQASEIIDNAGITVDTDILEGARWLVENNIPLTEGNINILVGLEDLTKGYDKEMVFDRILHGMKEGRLPGDIILIDKEKTSIIDSISQKDDINGIRRANIKQLIEDIHGITEDEIVRTVETDKDITIKNLIDIPDGDLASKKIIKENLSKENQVKVITAKRQLEEIRLKMTMEAALRLEKQGFNIDTETLEKLVDKLRLEEEIYYKELYSHEKIEDNEASIKLLQMTTRGMEELKFIPSYVLGVTLGDRLTQTVSGLLDAGRTILNKLDKAKEAYETLLTKPRAEYGDSIKKAFDNMDSLMKELGIENTQYNKRAIRILAYNQMDITKESIEQIKAYDLSVNYLIQNLNPAVAMQIIKDGLNPMDIPIDELNDRIDILKEEGYSSLDKYSSYLYRLERKEGISEAERKAYIGIYRLLYQIEKSDGAALGALIKSNQEITLNHLLIALRTARKGEMDYKIDDKFGLLQDVSLDKESITDQLRAIFNKEQIAENESQKAIVKELFNNLTPGKLQQLHKSIMNMSMSDNAKGQHAQYRDAWDTIGNMPMEQLLDQVKNIQESPGEDQAYYYNKIKELQDIYSNSDQAIHFLNDFKFPCTTTNLMMAGQILNNSGTVFKRLYRRMQDEKDEKIQKGLKKKLNLSDTLIDNKTMNKAYEQLEEEVKTLIEEESMKHMDFAGLTQLKSIGMQMHFMRNLAKREFYQIPIEASGKITNINLIIIRGKATGGKVAVSLISDSLGSIKAEASLKDGMLKGYITCDHVEGLKILESQTESLKSVLQEESISINQLNFCLQQASDALYSYQSPLDLEGDRNPETERILYRLAKAMIHMIRLAEEANAAVA